MHIGVIQSCACEIVHPWDNHLGSSHTPNHVLGLFPMGRRIPQEQSKLVSPFDVLVEAKFWASIALWWSNVPREHYAVFVDSLCATGWIESIDWSKMDVGWANNPLKHTSYPIGLCKEGEWYHHAIERVLMGLNVEHDVGMVGQPLVMCVWDCTLLFHYW